MKAKVAFEMELRRVPMDRLLPTRKIDEEKKVARYGMIVSSIKQTGLIEPLSIFPQKGKAGNYLIVDGHLRFQALRELKHTEVDCLVANDDEAFTYNARISRVSPIQEHRMIVKAVNSGVSPERIAEALNKPVRDIKAMINLLKGIHEEAAELLRDKPLAQQVIYALRRVTPERQIEIAELMISLGNYTRGYAEALVLGTQKHQLAKPDEPKVKKGLSAEEITRMEAEMESVEKDFRAVEQSYGENVLNLTVTRTYVKKLLENSRVARFLATKHADLLAEFEAIVAMEAV